MSKLDQEIDILIELNRLETLYKHYRNLYRKVMLLCCSNQRSITKFNRDFYRDKVKIKRKELNELRAPIS